MISYDMILYSAGDLRRHRQQRPGPAQVLSLPLPGQAPAGHGARRAMLAYAMLL